MSHPPQDREGGEAGGTVERTARQKQAGPVRLNELAGVVGVDPNQPRANPLVAPRDYRTWRLQNPNCHPTCFRRDSSGVLFGIQNVRPRWKLGSANDASSSLDATPRIVVGALVLVAIAVGVAYVPTLDANSHDLIIGDATTLTSGGLGDFGGLDDSASLVHPLPADVEDTLLVVVVTSEAGDGQLCKASSVRVGGRSLSLAVAERVVTRGSDHTNCVSLWYRQLDTGPTPTDQSGRGRHGSEPVNQRAIGAYTLGNAPYGAPLATFTSTLNAGDGATIRTPVEIPNGGFAIDAVVGGADFTVPKALGPQITQFQILAPSSQAGASVLTDASARTMGWQFGQHFRSAHVVAVFGDVNLRVEGGTIVHDETPGDGVIDGDDQGDDVKGIASLNPEVQSYVESLTHLDTDVGSPMGVARKTGAITAVATGGAEVAFHAGGSPGISTGLRTASGAWVFGREFTARDRDNRPSLAVIWGQTDSRLGLARRSVSWFSSSFLSRTARSTTSSTSRSSTGSLGRPDGAE